MNKTLKLPQSSIFGFGDSSSAFYLDSMQIKGTTSSLDAYKLNAVLHVKPDASQIWLAFPLNCLIVSASIFSNLGRLHSIK